MVNTRGIIVTTKTTILSAAVLTLNTVPVILVPAPGVGYAIHVVSGLMKSTYNSIAYATNTQLYLITSGASNQQNTLDISFSADYFGGSSNSGPLGGRYVENADLLAKVPSGNPTAGNSNITLYVSYLVITL